MKIILGRTANDAKFLDDDGNEIESLHVAELDIRLLPNEATKVRMTVYVDELIVEDVEPEVKKVPRQGDVDYMDAVRKTAKH